MRTQPEIKYAFEPQKLSETQKHLILKTEMAFKELAETIIDLAPETADRTAALRKVLEAKFMTVQAITHPGQAPQKVVETPSEPKTETPANGKNNKKTSKNS